MANPQPFTENILKSPQAGIGQLLGGPTQEIMLTTLANGMQDGKLRISVFVGPRLRPAANGPLSQFPTFLDWPKFVSAMKFKAFVGPNADQATPVELTPLWSAATLDSPLWLALFPPTTLVRPYPKDKEGCQPNYDIKPIVLEKPFYRNVIKEQIYQATAIGEVVEQRIKGDAFTHLPISRILLQQLERAGILVRDPDLGGRLNVGFSNPLRKLNSIEQQLQQSTPQMPGGGLSQQPGIPTPRMPLIRPRGIESEAQQFSPRLVPQSQLVQAAGVTPAQLLFLEYQVAKQLLRAPLQRVPPKAEPLDFHQIVSHLGEYPAVMRRLGLVLDFLVNADTSKLPPSSNIWVRPIVDANAARQYISPRSRYQFDVGAGTFRLISMKSSDDTLVRDGCLRLGLSTFDVVPGDVEGSAEKIEKFAQLVLNAAPTLDQQNDGGLPALRSGGLAVAQTDRDLWLNAVVTILNKLQCSLEDERQDKNFPPDRRGTSLQLGLEHCVRGLRVDVRELFEAGPPGPWRSLCFRKGQYLVGPNHVAIPNMPEDEGWVSIGSMKPTIPTPSPTLLIYESLFRWNGWSLSATRPGKTSDKESLNQAASSPRINMQVHFDPVPGTLPKLRFGRHYQFRARVVDLAGNSLTVNEFPDLPNDLVTNVHDGFYDRLEPVGSPIVLLKYPLLGPPTAACPQGQPLAPGESVERLVIRTTNVEGGGPAAGPGNQFSARHVAPPQVSQELAEAHGMFDDPSTGKFRPDAYGIMTGKDGTFSTSAGSVPGFGADGKPLFEHVHPEESVTVPYLPDPLAAGVTFFNLPGTAATQFTLQQPFAGSWPNRTTFQLRLEAGNAAPSFNGNTLQVFLPPGEQLIVQMSSHFAPKQETLLGVWRWMEEAAAKNPQMLQQLRSLVRAGRHWMATPFREIVLMHATQQPVLTPQWVSLVVGPPRQPGQTSASLIAMMNLHSPSTQKLDVIGTWIDPVDDGPWPPAPPSDPSANPYSFLFVPSRSAAFEIQVPLDKSRTGCESNRPHVGIESFRPGFIQKQAQVPKLAFPRGVEREAREETGSAETEAAEQPESAMTESPSPPVETPEDAVQERGVTGALRQYKPSLSPKVLAEPKQSVPSPLEKTVRPGLAEAQADVSKLIRPSGPIPYDESKHRCAPPPPNPPQRTPMTFDFCGVHQFGDTKYRCVEYAAVAASRYREYFYPLPDFPNCPQPVPVEPNFTRMSGPIRVDILSSAPPATPRPLYVIPTFRWEDSPQGRRRIGGGLRIYLERPWFSSGMGEQLAVVLFGHDYPAILEPAKLYVTQWGLDPLWVGGESPLSRLGIRPGALKDAPVQAPPDIFLRGVEPEEPTERGIAQSGVAVAPQGDILKSGPQIAVLARETVGVTYPQPVHFKNAAAVREDLVLANVVARWPKIVTTPSGGMASQLPLQGTPLPVKICAFNVLPDHDRQLWYCDIEMDPGTAYFPFVRLALARYQVNSIPGAHLSPIVLADFAQLMPERSASVVVNPSNVSKATVSVSGVNGTALPARTSTVEVIVEQANPTVPGEIGWSPAPGSQAVALPRVNTNQWVGEVTLPPPGGPAQYRLVVKEYEVFALTEEGAPLRREERRLVYADVLPIRR